jgi:hypothetical protein
VFVKRILTHILHFISPCLLLSCSLVNLPCWFHSAAGQDQILASEGKGIKHKKISSTVFCFLILDYFQSPSTCRWLWPVWVGLL